MNNSGNIPYSNYSEDIQNNEIELPSFADALLVSLPYALANLIFAVTTLVYIPIFSDAVKRFGFAFAVDIIQKFYVFADIIAAFLILLSTVAIYSMYVKKKFPSFLSLSVVIYNDITCIASALFIYNINVRNLYIPYQVILLVPIITIVLSTVFLADDCHDLRKGKYVVPASKKRRKKGELLSAQSPDFNPDEIRFGSFASHEKIIENAAKMAIPELNNTPDGAAEAVSAPEVAATPTPVAAPTPELSEQTEVQNMDS